MMKENYPGVYLYKRIVHAKLFIDDHFSDHIDLDNIAGEACFSKFHFIRLFKNIYGNTPHQYLIKVRIENAKLLLEKGTAINNTCLQVGFDSVTSFAARFRQYTGICPSGYQRQFLQRQEQISKLPLQFIPNCYAEHMSWTENSNFQEAL